MKGSRFFRVYERLRLIFGSIATRQLFLRAPTQDDSLSRLTSTFQISAKQPSYPPSTASSQFSNDPTHVLTMHEINRQGWIRSSQRCQIVRTSSAGGLIGHRRAPKLLRERRKTTLSTLVAAFKTQATS